MIFTEKPTQTKIISDAGFTYICSSDVGFSDNVNKWQIARIDANGNKMFPIDASIGDPTFAAVFNPTLALTYDYGYTAV